MYEYEDPFVCMPNFYYFIIDCCEGACIPSSGSMVGFPQMIPKHYPLYERGEVVCYHFTNLLLIFGGHLYPHNQLETALCYYSKYVSIR